MKTARQLPKRRIVIGRSSAAKPTPTKWQQKTSSIITSVNIIASKNVLMGRSGAVVGADISPVRVLCVNTNTVTIAKSTKTK